MAPALVATLSTLVFFVGIPYALIRLNKKVVARQKRLGKRPDLQ